MFTLNYVSKSLRWKLNNVFKNFNRKLIYPTIVSFYKIRFLIYIPKLLVVSEIKFILPLGLTFYSKAEVSDVGQNRNKSITIFRFYLF